ncbi:hypothetical protein WJX84_005195 [Apatococcus fuscideae]|uniref:Uncharacterized protein n=1 Tax=Apatococcus fuscideae TaxID=2026836 RepID=A0AAW1SYF3_9CHLO
MQPCSSFRQLACDLPVPETHGSKLPGPQELYFATQARSPRRLPAGKTLIRVSRHRSAMEFLTAASQSTRGTGVKRSSTQKSSQSRQTQALGLWAATFSDFRHHAVCRCYSRADSDSSRAYLPDLFIFTVATAVPVFKGVPRKGNSFFSSDAELINGRWAMVGFAGMVISTFYKGSALWFLP